MKQFISDHYPDQCVNLPHEKLVYSNTHFVRYKIHVVKLMQDHVIYIYRF
jgi:hypothetical protein